MDHSSIIHLVIRTLFSVFLMSLPVVVATTHIGLTVSIVQTVTQVQDQTLSFGLKLVAAGATLALTGKWMAAVVCRDAAAAFDLIIQASR